MMKRRDCEFSRILLRSVDACGGREMRSCVTVEDGNGGDVAVLVYKKMMVNIE